MPTPRRLLAGVLCLVALLAGAACDPLAGGRAADPAAAGQPGPGQQGPGQPGQQQGANAALAQLDGLTVAAWTSMAGYSRDRFPHWASQGGGCDTRDVVLKRDGRQVAVGDACSIAGGRWVSPYDSVTVTDPADLDIDHMVPLANAWRTGASSWTDERRGEFANDLTRPQLLAVTASSNRSKGDQDPSQWKPPNRGFWCTYAQDWIAVKAYWRLAVTEKEKAALADMLETC